NELEEVNKEKESTDLKIEKFENASKDLDRLLESQKLDKDKNGVGFNEYCAVPPPPAQVYSPPKKDMSWMGLSKFVDDTITDYTRPTPSIDVLKSVSKEQEERWKTQSNVKRPFERKSAAKNKVWSLTFRPKIPTVGSKVPTAKPVVAANKGNKGKVVKASARWIWKPKQNSSGQGLNFNGIPHDNINDKGYWDNGCSRNMTGNISYLSDYEPFNGGYVSFGHGRGKITGKGSIKTGKYFKLVDDKHVLLRTPRQQNMYTIDLKNVVPHKNLTCLIAKASINESMPWHRRLGHLNFKTMNKLVRSNLVKGLPSKSFENDHSCVACLKRKQHKASFVVAGTSSTNLSGCKKDDEIPDNNSLQKEQQDVNRDKEVPESSQNSNPVASTKVSTNDSFELASSSTVETEVPIVSSLVPTDSLYVPPVTSSVPKIISKGGSSFLETLSLGNAMSFENRLEDFFGDTSNAFSLNEVEADLRNMDTAIQEEGIDYEEVFAPVARIKAIRLFLAYAFYMGFTVYQMDVKSALLYGTINEEVYVMWPSGFQDPEFPHRVYNVEKAMYALHQAPRAWYGTLSKYLLDNGFQRGLQVLQKKDGIFLSKDKYVGDILKKIGYTDIRAAKTPMDRENPWGNDGTGKDVELHLHQVTPKECHLHAVKRIFRYLKGNPKLGLWYPKESPFYLVAYSNSDYSGANQDRKSTTGGCQFLGRSCKWLWTSALDTKSVAGLWSKVPSPGADETTFPIGDVRYGEAFPTDSSLDAGGRGIDQGEDLLDRYKSANKRSDSTDEMSHVLGSLGAENILASGGLRSVFTTASLLVATTSTNISPVVATASGSFPTAVIFTTASVATPTTRVTRSSSGVVIGSSSLISVNISSLISVNIPSISKKNKGKGKMTEPEQPSKDKVLEQLSVQLAKDLEAKFAQEDLIIREQAKRDYEISRIHAEKELEMMIAELDRSNKMVAKYLSEYEQAEVGFLHDEKKVRDLKRPGVQLDKERIKKLKTTEASGIEPTQEQQSKEPKELSEEELKKMMDTTKVTDEKANELWVELKRLYELDPRDPLWVLQRLSVPTIDGYIAKKLATVEDFALLHEDKIYSESKTRETVFATGRRSFIESGTGLRMKRINRRTRVPTGLYPCHIEENMTIKEVKGESVMEWKTKVTTKDHIVIKFPGKFRGYKLAMEEEVEENEGLKKVWEHIEYVISDNDSDLESTASS
nr:hypothetical protein [Tanacetum cinerariifolium]